MKFLPAWSFAPSLAAILVLACSPIQTKDSARKRAANANANEPLNEPGTDVEKSTPGKEEGEPFNKSSDEQVASEPVQIGGAFLANCGSYGSQTITNPAFGCAVQDSDTKIIDTTVTQIVLTLKDARTVPVAFSLLSADEPWNASFTLPAGVGKDEVTSVSLSFKVQNQSYQKSSIKILDGKAPILPPDPSDVALPASLSYALTQPTTVWEADFSKDPAMIDLNHDNSADWTLAGGTVAKALVGGVLKTDDKIQWKTTALKTSENLVSVDFAMEDLTLAYADSGVVGAQLRVNLADPSGDFEIVTIRLRRQANGTQTVNVYSPYGDGTVIGSVLVGVPNLPLGMIKFALQLNQSQRSLKLKVNGVEYTSPAPYGAARNTPQNQSTIASVILDSPNSRAKFSYVKFGAQ